MSQNGISIKHPYRADIDGLRAIAILAVVGYHAFPKLIPGGFIGVDIFFVISGYLISGIILRNLEVNTFSFSDFYFRRIKRIFPALIIVMAFTLIGGWIILFDHELTALGKHARYGTGFASNFLLWKEAGYFDTSSELKPFLHLWSLCIEEQFYIIWPLALYGFWKLNINLIKVTFTIILASFLLNLFCLTKDPIGTFYSPWTRFWEILFGSLLYNVTTKHCIETKSYKNLLSIIGLIFVCVCFFIIQPAYAYPGWLALIPVIGTCFLIIGGPESWLNKNIFSLKISRWFGNISFPLYLWHWPILAFARIILGNELSPYLLLLLIAMSFLLSWATFKFIENPIRLNVRSFRKKHLVTSICLMILLGFSGYFFEKRIFKAHTIQANIKITQAINDWKFPGDNFIPLTFQDRGLFSINSRSPKKTLYIGDSNIEQYGMRINSLIQQNPLHTNSAIFFTAPGCPPIQNIKEPKHPACMGYANSVLDYSKSQDIDTIVIGALWFQYFDGRLSYQFSENGNLYSISPDSEGARKALLSFENMIRKWVSDKKKVYLVLSIPTGNSIDPKHMFIRFPFSNLEKVKKGISRADLVKKHSDINNRLKDIGTRVGAIVIDPLDALCNRTFCPATTDEGDPVYKDDGHLRTSYVVKNISYLDETILSRTTYRSH
jgi:peptidoglycan/LPS O-acetylase OafA/YrhL